MALRELALLGDDAERLLARERLFAQPIPTLVELPLVPVRPLLRHVVRGVGCARRKVGEERLVGHERFLLANPLNRLGRHVLRQVIPLFGRLRGFDRRRALIERRIPLARLAADEAIEVLEPAAAAGPGVERAHWARLPDGNFVALAELSGGVAVQLERPRDGRDGIGHEGGVARRRCR